jgi:acetylornithine deacetylase/succinyl-diaminopimelate desuccinylase-like protein
MLRGMRAAPALLLALAACTPAASAAGPTSATPSPALRAIYQELVEIDTSQSVGDTAKAAKAMGARLTAAGIPAADVHVFETGPKRGDLVARLRGTGKRKPLLLMAHIDVVEARREDWTTEPFKLVEKDGYYYARGSGDDKAMASQWVALFARLAQERYKPDRDLILMLECDEEISDEHGYGVTWIIKNHRDLIDAEFAINEGASVGVKDGKPVYNGIQTSEKLYQSFWLEVRNAGGHSSQPRNKDNAIYQLADALGRLENFTFPFELNDTTRGYFQKLSQTEKGPLAADMRSAGSPKPDPAAIDRLSALPFYNAQLRTTCVATRLEGGHADNALPQLARAGVNCRILPGHSVDEVQQTLAKVLAEPKLVITPIGHDDPSAPSPIAKELFGTIEKLTAKYWPGAPVVPMMSAGATDGRYLRNIGIPTYGHSGLAADIADNRAHGKDERVNVKAFADEERYLYELVKSLAGGK